MAGTLELVSPPSGRGLWGEAKHCDQYANSMPSMYSRRYHGHFYIEAQEQILPKSHWGKPFQDTLLGMLPPELREKIYIYALHFGPKHRVHFDPKHRDHFDPKQRTQGFFAWAVDHTLMRKDRRKYNWPPDSLTLSKQWLGQPETRLVASFPPSLRPRAISRLDLLMTCRQIYNEALHLYSSANHFNFIYASLYIEFCQQTPHLLRREITSVQLDHAEGSKLGVVLTFLKECHHLRELRLWLDYNEEPHFEELRGFRGLLYVDIRPFIGRRHNWSGISIEEKERILKEIREFNSLLKRPKELTIV